MHSYRWRRCFEDGAGGSMVAGQVVGAWEEGLA